MAISLGGVILSKNLIWVDSLASPYQAYSRRITLLGKIIVQHSPISGRMIALSTISTANGSIGFFTKGQLDQLRIFEKAMTVVTFVYEAENLDVLIAPGGMEVSPIVPRPTPASSDYYTGSIQLIEVAT